MPIGPTSEQKSCRLGHSLELPDVTRGGAGPIYLHALEAGFDEVPLGCGHFLDGDAAVGSMDPTPVDLGLTDLRKNLK